METTHTRGVRVGSDITIGPEFAARAFYDLYREFVVLDSGVLWIFNKSTGMWTNKDVDFRRAITLAGPQLIFIQNGRDIIHNFSGDVRKSSSLLRKLAAVVPPQNGFFHARLDSAIGKLLFADGIYDFKSDTFTPGFDPDTVFHSAIPRPFPKEVDKEALAFVKKTLFRDPFRNEAVGDTFLHVLMRGIYGGDSMKKFLICIGPTNSSKSTVCELLRNAFGEAIGGFSGDVKRIHTKRVLLVNEMMSHKKLLTTINKNQPLIVLFANTVNKVLRDKSVTISLDYSFVHEPREDFEKPADPLLKTKLRGIRYLDGFVHLILQTYREWAAQGCPSPVLPEASGVPSM